MKIGRVQRYVYFAYFRLSLVSRWFAAGFYAPLCPALMQNCSEKENAEEEKDFRKRIADTKVHPYAAAGLVEER